MKKIILFTTFLAKAIFSYAQLADDSISPDWMLNDISGNKHQLYDYLGKDKAVILHFATTWNTAAWDYHKTNALENFYKNNGPTSAHYRARVFWIESDPSNNVACIYGSGKACIGSTKGNWTNNTTFPFLDNASLKTTFQVSSFPYSYLVCPNKKIYTIGLLNETDLETTMQTKCASPLVPLSYNISLVRNNDCFGDKNGLISLTTGGGVPPYDFTWSNGETHSLITKLAAGSYTCTITDSKGASLVTNTINILQNDVINISSDVKNIQACGNKGEIKLVVKGGVPNYSYQWGNGAITNNLKNLSASGTYFVSVTDNKGCKAIDTIEVGIFDNIPHIIGDSLKILTCSQNSVNFEPTILPSNGSYHYLWTNNKGVLIGNSPNLLDISLPDIFNLSVVDLNSQCLENKRFEVIQEKSVPLVDFGIVKDLYCNNKTTILKPSISGGNNFNFNWNSEKNGIITPMGGADSIVINEAGIYYITVTNSETGCAKATKQKIDFWKDPILSLELTNPIRCFGDSTAILSAEVNDGKPPFQLKWSNGVIDKKEIIGLKSGYYSLSVTDANGCLINASDTITTPPSFLISYQQVNPTNSLSKNGSIDLSILGGTPPYQITWKKSINVISTKEDLDSLTIGTYRANIIDANNCTINTQAIILTAPAVSNNEINSNYSFQVYPNPITDILTLEFNANDTHVLGWQLFDIQGVLLQKESIKLVGNHKTQIVTNQLYSGIYFLVVNIDGQQLIRKIIKS